MDSDEEHSDNNNSYNTYKHYSPYFGGNASEYIVPKIGTMDITSHGMGSGIYCLSQKYVDQNPPSKNENSNEYTFIIEQPFVILSDEECDNYIRASKQLMSELEIMRKNSIARVTQVTQVTQYATPTIDDFVPLAKNFIDNISRESKEFQGTSGWNKSTVSNSLFKFWADYHTRDDMVEMPINYILKGEGFDGVASAYGLSCHSWSKGNVKFVHYPTYKVGDSVPVKTFLLRSGFDKPIIDLMKHNYIFCGQLWVKQPSQEANKACWRCKSIDHKPLDCPTRISQMKLYKT